MPGLPFLQFRFRFRRCRWKLDMTGDECRDEGGQLGGTEEIFCAKPNRRKHGTVLRVPAQIADVEHTGAEHLCCGFDIDE